MDENTQIEIIRLKNEIYKLQAKFNRISHALEIEKQDFEDSLDMEMSEDLFLNYRDQIQDIFKVLSKEGIEVKSK